MNRVITFYTIIFTFLLYQTRNVVSVVVPATSCYVLDNSSHLYDFSNWIGNLFLYERVDTDFAIRFCRDVELRSQTGYTSFGRFDGFNNFVADSKRYDFVQEYYNGDLQYCEINRGKRGRTAQVNIICGDCPNAPCKKKYGCVCNVTSESNCRVIVELVIPCESPGPRVFEGFTVGFRPWSSEIVYNGMTQYGYEKGYKEYSFDTEQRHVSLYMTAVASVSKLVQKPTVTVSPKTGLEVTLSGSGATGNPPTTLSPTLLNIDWRCETTRDDPYIVQLTIPVEGYDPIQFNLTKMCESRQNVQEHLLKDGLCFGKKLTSMIL